MRPISVLIVDDHALFRQGLMNLLREFKEIRVVGEAADAEAALHLARQLRPDLILMDIRMPGLAAFAATRQIKQELPQAKVVVLTASEEEKDLFEAIKAGAEGYILKDTRIEELVRMLTGVFRGEAPISGVMAAKMLGEFARRAQHKERRPDPTELTAREREVLSLVAKGASNFEISRQLHISENTVKKHLRSILDKLHLENRVQAAIYALQEDLIGSTHLE
ncbi:MAG: response regulator transcription factor [Anaerolineae bacterium]|nr:response regulator transcription factor [Anaerolineae bacterium]MDW8097967.1 response regulator transcription factor [Anaerolineae bacterium]